MNFKSKLSSICEGPGLCVGLDPVWDRIPEYIRSAPESIYAFCTEIIENTYDIAAAYKPNLAFFESFGPDGWRQLEKIIRAVPDDCLVIADGKRGDIGSTAKSYAVSLFDNLNCDAATVSPYLGGDAIEPFIERADRGAFVLTLTSNPGGSDLQELICNGDPLYKYVIRLARKINIYGNVGLVIGATKPELWSEILDEAVDMPLLIPGIGAQGGDIEALKAVLRSYPAPALVNASRSIIYASSGRDLGKKAREAAIALNDQLKL